MEIHHMTWTCHICVKERPDESISVQTNDRSAELGWPLGTIQENVRYCNDNSECVRKSKTFHLILKFDMKSTP